MLLGSSLYVRAFGSETWANNLKPMLLSHLNDIERDSAAVSQFGAWLPYMINFRLHGQVIVVVLRTFVKHWKLLMLGEPDKIKLVEDPLTSFFNVARLHQEKLCNKSLLQILEGFSLLKTLIRLTSVLIVFTSVLIVFTSVVAELNWSPISHEHTVTENIFLFCFVFRLGRKVSAPGKFFSKKWFVLNTKKYLLWIQVFLKRNWTTLYFGTYR